MAAPPKIFDRALIARRLARRSAPGDFVLALVLEDLAERLLTVSRRFERALIMAPMAGALPLAGTSGAGEFAFARAATAVASGEAPLLDPENLRLPRDDHDLVVSLLDLQCVSDVPGLLARVRAHLAPDGLFLAAALGGDTLIELRQAFLAADAEVCGGAFARVAPTIPLAEAGPLLQRTGFALPVADVETRIVRYASPLALFEELRLLGASNPLADRPQRLATPKLLAAASEAYRRIAADPDGRVRATLEIVWFSGWSPHESQQKPLAPGSARVSLADVLGKKG